jgi:hypothetical protein
MDKLKAKVDVGISYRDYSVALGEANFAVTQFLESDRAESVPEFSNSLRKAMSWYVASERLWDRHMKNTDYTYWQCDPKFDPERFGAKELCDAYPELVTIDSHERTLAYEDALQETWKRAALELKRAEQTLKR